MDYYNVRIRIPKAALPKFKEDALQWEAVKTLVREGKAAIAVLERSEEEFERPGGLQPFPEWQRKFSSDCYIEDSLLLSEEEATRPYAVFQKIYENLERSNMLDYSYATALGRFESFGRFDDASDHAGLLTKEERAAAKKEARAMAKKGRETKETPEARAARKQVALFKKNKGTG